MNNINLEQSFSKLKTSLNTKSMLIETTTQQTRTVEIKLPFYSKKGASFYLITDDENVIQIIESKDGCYISAAKEFWDAYYKARDILEEVYPNPLVKLQKQSI